MKLLIVKVGYTGNKYIQYNCDNFMQYLDGQLQQASELFTAIHFPRVTKCS